jgi:hypothetical protein
MNVEGGADAQGGRWVGFSRGRRDGDAILRVQ